MSERRSRGVRRRAMAMTLAAGGAAGLLAAAGTVPAQAASVASPPARCGFASHDLTYSSDSPARVVAQGECDGDGSLFVKIFRNGTLVWSGGNGAGIVTAIRTCQGSASGDFTAVWSTGQTDSGTFPCG